MIPRAAHFLGLSCNTNPAKKSVEVRGFETIGTCVTPAQAPVRLSSRIWRALSGESCHEAPSRLRDFHQPLYRTSRAPAASPVGAVLRGASRRRCRECEGSGEKQRLRDKAVRPVIVAETTFAGKRGQVRYSSWLSLKGVLLLTKTPAISRL